MEKLVMFIQCLCIVLLDIQVTSACTCTPPTLDEAMCGSNPVLMLTADTEELVDSDGNLVSDGSAADYTKHWMHLDAIYKTGSKNLMVAARDDFTIIIPRSDDNCGVVLEIDAEYYVSQETDEDKDINDLLNGNRKPRCGKRRRLVRMFQ